MRISDWSSDVCSSDLDKVAADLSSYGFAVTDITRINRQEFDVVTVLGDVIHNFQCKNNWIDLGKLESDRRLLARYNRRLDRYYRNALRKEAGREGLLLGKPGLARIEHHVISRFPVITDHPRIINYTKLADRGGARKRVVQGKSVSIRVDLGWRRYF